MFETIVFPLLKMFGIGLIGWAAIILCRLICIFTVKDFTYLYEHIDSEIIADGNNLFTTASSYILLGFIALCLSNIVPIISYIIIGIMILCCLPSIFTMFRMLKNPPHITTSMMFLSCVINTFTPLLMTIYFLINYII